MLPQVNKNSLQLLGTSQNDFSSWYNAIRKVKPFLPANPLDPNNDYDYKAFFDKMPEQAQAMLQGDPNAHFSDIGKRPWHPTFSNESAYSNNQTPGGQWVQNGDKWQFRHSDMTAQQSDKTLEYLRNNGNNEFSTYGGGFVMPSVNAK